MSDIQDLPAYFALLRVIILDLSNLSILITLFMILKKEIITKNRNKNIYT